MEVLALTIDRMEGTAAPIEEGLESFFCSSSFVFNNLESSGGIGEDGLK